MLILDPLLGHPEASRHITNLNLRGTIKELAQLDGGFAVSREGIVPSACPYLDTVAVQEEVPFGVGSRHIAAANNFSFCVGIGCEISLVASWQAFYAVWTQAYHVVGIQAYQAKALAATGR